MGVPRMAVTFVSHTFMFPKLVPGLFKQVKVLSKSGIRMVHGRERKMPQVGLGMWQLNTQELVSDALRTSVRLGYRLFDTSPMYENEAFIGMELQKMFQEGVVRREELFISTKLPANGNKGTEVEYFFMKSLKAFQLEYLDLYLVHFPVASLRTEDDDAVYPPDPNGNDILVDQSVTLMETWQAMEALVEKGLIKNIGICNCNSEQLKRVHEQSKFKPLNLQIECHAYLPQFELVNFAQSLGVYVTAYAPLGSAGFREFVKKKYGVDVVRELVLHDSRLQPIAEKHQKSPAQILLRFLVQRDINVIPRGANEKEMAENMNVFDFDLDDEDLAVLTSMDRGFRYFPFDDHPSWKSHPEYPFNISY